MARSKQHRRCLRGDHAGVPRSFRKCDVIATPTTPTTAFTPQSEKTSDPLEVYASDICTVTVNIAGLPGISVPCGFGAGAACPSA
ncbi:MAG: amidase family protein, partial [Ruthenibacterium lactatiformans]